MGGINAAAAYTPGGPLAIGASGVGIVVGVIDTGVQLNNPELTTPNTDISPQSTDVVTDPGTGQPRNQPNGVNLHATWVSDTIAGEFNSFGTLGVAYQATILSVRADDFGTCTGPTSNGCTFSDDNQALAINFIVNSNHPLARIVNISLGGPGPLDSNFETALQNAVNDGVVFTIAAGNDNGGSVEFPAAYAIDPRYIGSVLAVGSVSCSASDANLAAANCGPANLSISSFSAVADAGGVDARTGFVVAPGDRIITDCDINSACEEVSGTSFAAPTAAGALALLLQAFPTLSGKQAIQLLENTANHSGVFANSMIYGFGLIDLQAAFMAQGPLSVPQANGSVVSPAAMGGSMVSTALGDSIARTGALKTIGFDSYDRPFVINMASGFHVAPRRSLQTLIDVPQETAEVDLANGPARFSLTTDTRPDDQPSDFARRGRDDLRIAQDRHADVSLEADLGRFSFQAWTGQNGMAPAPGLGASDNAFAMLAQPDHAVRAGYQLGQSWSLSAEAGGGSPYALYGFNNLAPSRYGLAEARFSHGPLSLTLSAGQLLEPEGPLGSFLPRGSTYALPAQTGFTTARIDWTATDWLLLSAQAGVGRTHASGLFLDLSVPAVSSQWRLSASTLCTPRASNCLRFDASVGQPTRIEAGTFSAVLGDVPARAADIVEFTHRQFSATPSGREFDLSFGVSRDLDHFGQLGVKALGVVDEDNQQNIPPNLGVLASWHAKF